MTDTPSWWQKGQHAVAFNRTSAGSKPCKPNMPRDKDASNTPKLGLHGGPKPPKFLREEVDREAREKAARDRYLSKYLENDNSPADPTPKLDNSL